MLRYASVVERERLGVPDITRSGADGWAPTKAMKDKAATALDTLATNGVVPEEGMCGVSPFAHFSYFLFRDRVGPLERGGEHAPARYLLGH